MGKELCKCGKMAVWIYMPGYGDGGSPYSCDDCVISEDDKIGCSCNWNYGKEQEGLPTDLPEGIEGKDWAWIEREGDEEMHEITKEEKYWINLDERGRPYPCVEYEYSEEGFDVTTWWSNIYDEIWWKSHKFKQSFKRWWKRHIVDDVPEGQDF